MQAQQVLQPHDGGKIHSLENLRGFAAIYVFLCHFLSVGHAHFSPFAFGKEAVFLFFFLSGFVIFNSHQQHPEQSFQTYFFRRFLRIFPLFFLCLLVSWLCLGLFQPAAPDRTWTSLFGNIFMLQDEYLSKPGVWIGPFCGNSPLWSLSYEWWFYLMFFPLVNFLPVWQQRYTVGLMTVLAFLVYCAAPNQASLFLMYFPVWWAGLELARIRRAEPAEKRNTHFFLLGVLAVMAGISSVRVAWAHHLHLPLAFGDDPVLELRNFSFCLLCVAFVAFTPVRFIKLLLKGLYPFGWLAPISYAIYILHMPLVVKANYLAFIGVPWIQSIGYILILFAVATFGETVYQSAAKRLFKFLTTRRKAAPTAPLLVRPVPAAS